MDFLVSHAQFDLIDLNDYAISYYDYQHKNSADDFIPLMEKITSEYGTLIFATPVYWYTMSAVMKTFFDRISDLLRIRKDVGRQLRGKNMAVVSCSSDDEAIDGFELPFTRSAQYLGMPFVGFAHCWMDGNEMPENVRMNLVELAEKIKTQKRHSEN